MEISTSRLRIASNRAVESPPQKTMVLTRTNGTQSTASSTTNSTNKSNVNGMISFETRGSTSFDAREKKLGSKYAHKSRNHGRDEFIMLQRPTPIILAKPSIREPETSPVVTLYHQMDENSKPLSKQPAKTTMPILMTNGHLKDTKSDQQQQPILANLSTNLKSLSTNKLSEQVNRSSSKEYVVASNVASSINKEASSSTVAGSPLESVGAKLSTAGRFMNAPVQLLDENLSWKDSLVEFLADQSDFLVVGVLGKRGSGKSTLMSLLAGTKFNHANLFKEPSSKSTDSHQSHKTSGVRAFVTSERTILLDVQPLLSSSLLDKVISMDNNKKQSTNSSSNGSDFKYYENFIEMQSIELACLMLSICNVVLVTEDCFIDPNLFRLLQTAEMLMPSNVVQGGESQDMLQWDQKYPHLVYVLNKCEAVNKSDIGRMKAGIDSLLSDSKLVYKSSLPEMTAASNLILRAKKTPVNNSGDASESSTVNFVVLPKVDSQVHMKQKSTEFVGMASLERTIKCLTRDILAIRRINNVAFTEKKWLTYANRVWDTIRKSPLITEYNRLMT